MRVIEKDAFWHDFFYTAVTTGLRRGEICALRWEDFDTKQETLHVRRTLHKEKGKPLTTGDRLRCSERPLLPDKRQIFS